MSPTQLPRRPLSPWAVGAAGLGIFVALAVVLDDSTAAVQVMMVCALVVGLLLVRTGTKGQKSSSGAAPSSQAGAPEQAAQHRVAPPVMPTESLPPVLTIHDVADYLQSDANTVAAELDAGRLPGNKLSGEWRIRKAALDVWLDGSYGAAAATSGD